MKTYFGSVIKLLGKGNIMNEYLMGRRVRIYLLDQEPFAGVVYAAEGSRLLLWDTNDENMVTSQAGAVLIDTTSGGFVRLDVLEALGDAATMKALLENAEQSGDSKEAQEESIRRQIFPLQSLIDDLPINETRLNPMELALLQRHPIDGTRALLAARTAQSQAEAKYQAAGLHNHNGDAFRHALWNALMVRSIGSTRAQEWGDAHENGNPSNPTLEKDMDLFNNAIGRGIVLQSSDDDNAAANKVQAKVRTGTMRRIRGAALVPTDNLLEK